MGLAGEWNRRTAPPDWITGRAGEGVLARSRTGPRPLTDGRPFSITLSRSRRSSTRPPSTTRLLHDAVGAEASTRRFPAAMGGPVTGHDSRRTHDLTFGAQGRPAESGASGWWTGDNRVPPTSSSAARSSAGDDVVRWMGTTVTGTAATCGSVIDRSSGRGRSSAPPAASRVRGPALRRPPSQNAALRAKKPRPGAPDGAPGSRKTKARDLGQGVRSRAARERTSRCGAVSREAVRAR
jgi:hypothetical protein